MDRALARRLAAVTEKFYAAEASSFSETRNSAWGGWTRIAELLAQECRHKLGKPALWHVPGRCASGCPDCL